MWPRESKAKKPAERALSPLGSLGRLFNRKTNDRSLKTSSVELNNAAALHVPTVVAQKETDVPGAHVPIFQDEKPPGVYVPSVQDAKPPGAHVPSVQDAKPAGVPVPIVQDAKFPGAPIMPVTLVEADAPYRIELKFPDGTLGTEIQSKPLEDLAKAFEDMIAKVPEGSRFETAKFIKQIDDVTVKASDFSANFSAKAQAFLAAVPSVSSTASEAVEKVMATIDGIASAHPILKISWFIVSAGYKIVSDASKVDGEYLELPDQFQDISDYVTDFLKLPIKGIANDKERSNLVRATESIIICLKDAAVLFTEYMDKPGTTWSNIFESNKNKLDEMKKRLADVQEAHEMAKQKGLFTIVVTIGSDVVDIKDVAHRVERVVLDNNKALQDINARSQAQSTKDAAKEKNDDLDKLRDLCKEIYPHSIEVATLVNRCATGTRKWIVDQALESIENGEEKITWLRCEAGTGKSVIAGRVAQELEQKGMLGATFLCKFNNAKRNSIVSLIQTIAFELADVNDQFRTALIETLKNCRFQDVNENKTAMPNIKELLQLFIEEPMKAWPKNTSVVVVIDALDEISNISENIHLLLGAFLRLSSVKLFITSRPEIKDESTEISTATKKSSVALIALKQNDERNLEDIRMFATSRVDTLFAKFPAFGQNERNGLVEMLVKNSTGLFIWINLVLDVDGHDSPSDKVTSAKKIQRAKVVKSHAQKPKTANELISRLEAYASMSLQDLYCRAFSEAFLDVDEKEKEFWLKLFRASVGTLMVMKVLLYCPLSQKQ